MYSDYYNGERPGVTDEKSVGQWLANFLRRGTGSKYFRLYEPISKME